MKKLISSLLLLSLLLISLVSCSRMESTNEISCEDIIKAYEDAGYSLGHHLHEDPAYEAEAIYCALMFEDPQDPAESQIYINRYETVADAVHAHSENKYNPILWLFFSIVGEKRWLHSGQYGEIQYNTFDAKMAKPLKELLRQGDTL